jgi:hypothetical protein
MKPDQSIQMIFQHHHHVETTQELTKHNPLIDPLASVNRVPRVYHLGPIPECGSLIVSPEF